MRSTSLSLAHSLWWGYCTTGRPGRQGSLIPSPTAATLFKGESFLAGLAGRFFIRPYGRRGDQQQPPGQRVTERNARKEEQGQIRLPPRLPTAAVMRGRAFSTAGVRRRDDGTFDTCHSDSHDPCYTKMRPERAASSSKRFLFHRSGGDFSLTRQRKVGAGIRRGTPAPPGGETADGSSIRLYTSRKFNSDRRQAPPPKKTVEFPVQTWYTTQWKFTWEVCP